jgi:hypothetical protein
MQAEGEPEIFQTERARRSSSMKETRLNSCIPQLTLNANGTTIYVNRGYKTKKHLFALAVPAITAEVAAAGVFQLAVALGTDADHVRHDGAGDGLLLRMLL